MTNMTYDCTQKPQNLKLKILKPQLELELGHTGELSR